MEEKHKCKICFRNFGNGRALGGHMRSHMMNLCVPPKPKKYQEIEESLPSSSCSESEQEVKELMSKGFMKKQRKRRICLMDSFAVHEATNTTTGSVVLDDIQDDGEESETDEDVAYCLIMLSRDKWNTGEEDEIEEKAKTIVTKVRRPRGGGGKYRCETCKRVFGSYQALGGHRASHKRIKVPVEESTMVETGIVIEEKVHQCPVCYRVFASGQALGGHKRSHGVGPVSRFGGGRVGLIDLNLPAPMEDDDDDDISQFEVSAVSDAEFVNYGRH